MEDSENSKREAEINPLDSVVKPLVEVTQAAKVPVENVTLGSSSYVTEVETEVEKLETLPTSDENIGESSEAAKSSSDETAANSKQLGKTDLDENPRSTHTQPFVAVAAGTQASWTNCCGLFDVLRSPDQ
ncbi:hypothetical protein Pfo_022565 [Paulownia fortunei]|nr:hypothetical protein Pfo_022565 [Paulownia fortunei]